jgi:PadR family transcriptional regulator, regulatory protein PadR
MAMGDAHHDLIPPRLSLWPGDALMVGDTGLTLGTSPVTAAGGCLDLYLGFHYIVGVADGTMTGQAFFVLTALADGPRHGYGIVGEVTELSQGRVKLKIGSLYGVLDRLTGAGLVEPDRDETHGGRLRRYYRLTPDGRRALAEEAELRAATAHVVRARLARPGPQAAG